MRDTENRGSRRKKTRPRNKLRLMQVNTHTSGPVQDVALNLAWEAQADILIVQEPWAHLRKGRRLTKNHSGFDAFAPEDDWSTPPNVLTYVRKTPSLQSFQIRPFNTPNACVVEVNRITIANVYRPWTGDSPLAELEAWELPQDTVVAGDFNAVHWTWQPGHGRHRGPGNRIAEWAESRRLFNINPEGPTHDRGNTIDLVFTNILGTETQVLEELRTGSDHYTLWTSIPIQTQIWTKTRKLTVHEDRLAEFRQAVKRNIGTITADIGTREGLERTTHALVKLLQEAIAVVGKEATTKGKPAAWWNDDCKAAVRRLRECYPEEQQREKEALRDAVRKTKRRYWEDQIANAKDDRDLFRITAWHKATDRFRSPPLVDGDRAITNPRDKTELLREKILYRFNADQDILDPWCPLETEPEEILWEEEVTLAEAEAHCIKTGNTTPGTDGVTVRLLQAAWPEIGSTVTALYQGCLQQGYHPKAFRTAEVAIIPKAERDPSSVRAYRPIALLSCLGKGLERLVARRMSYLAVKLNILSPQHFGALPQRSALDLAACAAHDVEQALLKHEASMLMMDVQGAFDAVLPNRLIKRLREQGWPERVVRWTQEFVTKRKARVRMEGVTTDEKELQCGVPQGSPASPILYMLYLSPLLKRGNVQTRFAYADDVAFLRTGKNTEETTKALTADLEDSLRWGKENAIAFAPDKYELIHFSRKRAPELSETIQAGGMTIHPTDKSVRWLGVYFDQKLNFRHHAEVWGAKGSKVAAHLRRLNGVVKGMPPSGSGESGTRMRNPGRYVRRGDLV
ncbi:Reverse transcriptase [Macrophomina phaseolina MS6]|uniref:Reverse transcriptase n=1 Tax=Macrophomina phaseolina (strain MS6) TaxID=1126212 RepID=K2R4N7_MACPH|nr:Reverse transcriptase [Macrophomina phaseolina MS6]